MKKLIVSFCAVFLFAYANEQVTPQVMPDYAKALEARMAPIEQEYAKMASNAQTTVDSIEANNFAIDKWDAELNKVYQLLMSSLNEDEKAKLRQKQRAWIKKRNAKVMQEAKQEGTMYRITSGSIFLEETQKRTKELAKMYDNLRITH